MTPTDTVVGTSMKVTCARDELAEKLQIVGRGVSTRTSVQILAGIMLRASEGQLYLSATDMEISLRVGLEAQVEDEGAVVVPGRLLVELVRLLPEDDVRIEHRAEEGVVRVSSGTYESRLHTYNVEDFPRLPDVAEGATFTVERDALLDTVARVS